MFVEIKSKLGFWTKKDFLGFNIYPKRTFGVHCLNGKDHLHYTCGLHFYKPDGNKYLQFAIPYFSLANPGHTAVASLAIAFIHSSWARSGEDREDPRPDEG
nr:uncharacterized protein LOC123002987 [Drosophila takahashii]